VKQKDRTAILFDEHPIWLEAVQQVLARIRVEVTGKATSAAAALVLVEKTKPDLFVTEIQTGENDVDGLALIRRAREIVPSMKAIVLSTYDDSDHIDRALTAGVVAYVLKTAHPDDLASAVRQAFDHSIYFAGSRTAPRLETADADQVAGLTRRELEILRLVAEGLPNAELARRLWVTEQTVKFHLSNIYRKLSVGNRTEASRWAQVHGLLPAPQLTISAA
jgi:DNA-binding NarL/FixJ family response regulator